MTTDYLQGHDAFPVPPNHQWRKDNVLKTFDQLVTSYRYGLDTLERQRDEIWHDPKLSTGVMSPYGNWAGSVVSTVTQNFGNLGSHLRNLVDHAAEVDTLLEDERADSATLRLRVAELERLAAAVVAKPSSRVERDRLAAALAKENRS